MKNNIKAFPLEMNDDSNECNFGMDLRDYFAAKALQGLIPIIGIPTDDPDDLWDEDTAKRAYLLADAMMKSRQVK